MLLLRQEPRAERRDERQREHERAEQSEGDGERERREHLPLEALEREEREEDDDDDRDAEHDRPAHFLGGVEDGVRLVGVVVLDRILLLGEVTEDVLDHHHSAVDHHADADGQAAERHEVAPTCRTSSS